MSDFDFFLVGNPVEKDEETVALLKYMTDHNRQHIKELKELSSKLENESKRYVLSALEDFENGNNKLIKALNEINK